MQVREIMSSPAISVSPTTTIQEVARIMRENQISGVPVVDSAGKGLGIITELALIGGNAPTSQPHYITVLSAMIPINLEEHREYREQLRQVLAVNAGELMEDEFQTVGPNTDVDKALKLMLDPEITLLPVVESGRVVGVVTRTDMVRLIEKLEMATDEDPPQAK